ncbi:MAG: hypothetical protein ONB42_05775 [candidate division KSB1 bacterium]|nr:hypothetical protein [candidate division KSB1 bacterium]
MKTRPHIFAIHFSVTAFELFCPQLACLSEKSAALGFPTRLCENVTPQGRAAADSARQAV